MSYNLIAFLITGVMLILALLLGRCSSPIPDSGIVRVQCNYQGECEQRLNELCGEGNWHIILSRNATGSDELVAQCIISNK